MFSDGGKMVHVRAPQFHKILDSCQLVLLLPAVYMITQEKHQ